MISFQEWRSDLPAGLVVFLVALPLCLGIALASGAPLFSGIIAGIVGGIVVTLFSDSPLGVSGPAAGLVAIVVVAIEELGFDAFLTVVVIAGAIQVLLGFLRMGVIGYYFPSAVIKGMLAGIGLIIILKQIPHAVGYDADYEGDLSFLQPDGHNTFTELTYAFEATSPAAISICLFCMAILIVWERPFLKKQPFAQIIQGPLVAVLAGIGLNLLFEQHAELGLSSEQLVSLPMPSSLTGFIDQFQFADFSALSDPAVYKAGLTLAIIASLASLLCAEATDKLDPQQRTTDLNRELIAQGMGNLIAGLIGGLPVAQVIIRSSTNIQSGGRTRLASLFHGLLLLVCAATIAGVLNLIPLASLAAILCMVGFKLAHPSKFVAMYRQGWDHFLPFVVTVVAILMSDLLIGIGIGMCVSLFFLLRTHSRHAYWLHDQQTKQGRVVRLVLSVNVSFLSKAGIRDTLQKIPPGSQVIVDASDSIHIDADVLEMLHEFQANAPERRIRFELRGFGGTSNNSRPPMPEPVAGPREEVTPV